MGLPGAALAAAIGHAPAPSLSWDEAFATAAAPRAVFFEADYYDAAGHAHRLKEWREENRRIRRETDDRLAIYVDRLAGGEYRYRVLDRQRKIAIRVDRENLYRIGMFSDWATMAHVLVRPLGEYALERGDDERTATTADGCAWYRLTVLQPAPRVSEICWSRSWGLPLAIRRVGPGDVRQTQFAIRRVTSFIPDRGTFAQPPGDYAEMDADGDVDAGSD